MLELWEVPIWKKSENLSYAPPTTKGYMHGAESILENWTQKFLRNFHIQTDHIIQARWPDQVTIDKKQKNCHLVDFAVLGDYKSENQRKWKRDKYFNLTQELKNYETGRWW